MSIGDEVFLFDQGRIVQSGDPRDLYLRPATRFSAEFFGKANFLGVVVESASDGVIRLRTKSGEVLTGPAVAAAPPGTACDCVIRPESWRMRAGAASALGPDWLPGEVAEILFLGNRTELIVTTSVGEQTVTQPGAARLSIGDTVALGTALEFLHLIPNA